MQPEMTLKLGSPVSTIVTSVLVDRGDHVKTGQLIARLESAVQEADVVVDEAKASDMADVQGRVARVQYTAQEAGRAAELAKLNEMSKQKADEEATDFRVAQQDLAAAMLAKRVAGFELQRARASLAQREIRSPIDGVVTQRLLGPGEYVQQDNAIAVVSATAMLHVEAYPPISAWAGIKVGDVAKVTLEQPAGVERDATVSLVDSVFDAASGTFGIRLTLPNRNGELPAGQRCHVTLGRAP